VIAIFVHRYNVPFVNKSVNVKIQKKMKYIINGACINYILFISDMHTSDKSIIICEKKQKKTIKHKCKVMTAIGNMCQ